MTPEELLRRYPRETLRWLRRRLGRSQLQFALETNLARTLLTHVCRYRWQKNVVLTRQHMSAGTKPPG